MARVQGARHLSGWYRLAIVLLKPPTLLLTRPTWQGTEHVPREGAVIVAANHISAADPVALTDFLLYGCRRAPRFLAKSSMFRGGGLVARVMRGAGQIPVDRRTPDAAAALGPAVEALRAGRCVALYPEGTVTRDPDKWPMVARTGVARLALLSGAPVVPVGQWGAQRLHDTYRDGRLRLRPRTPVVFCAGPPVDLSAYAGREPTADVLRAATADVMAAVTRQVERARGETAPAQVHDPSRSSDDAGRTTRGTA